MGQEKKPQMALNLRLKAIKKALKLSQKEMAERLGIATSTYQYYERGERDIPARVLESITTYGVNPVWLLTGRGDMFARSKDDLPTEDLSHAELVKYFKNKKLAKKTNWNLLKLESVDFPGFLEISEIIELKLKLKGVSPDSEVVLPPQTGELKNGTSD